jgi:NAD(P)-dependent dehydrogenase (short-subunit alcohol dehydrogenase family)
LAAAGAAVVVNYVTHAPAAEKVVNDLKAAGSQAIAIQADVSDEDWELDCPPDGNIVLTGELELRQSREFVLALAFGDSALDLFWTTAGHWEGRNFQVGVDRGGREGVSSNGRTKPSDVDAGLVATSAV